MTPSERRIITVLATGMAVLLTMEAPARACLGGHQQNGRIAFQRVFFGDDGSTVRIAIFTIRSNGTDPRRVTNPPRGVETGRMDWSPDGRWLAYLRMPVSGSPRSHIIVMRPGGTGREDLTIGKCRPSVCIGEVDPAWAPHGHRLAFIRVKPGRPNLFVMHRDGTHRHRVMAPPPERYIDSAPSWSPNGNRLVFSRFDQRNARFALFTVRLDGTDQRQLTPFSLEGGDYGIRPDWSPDGRWILFHTHRMEARPTQLCLIHPNGAGFRKITHTSESWAWGAFSPDGTMISAIRVPGGSSENDVYVMDLEGSGITPVTASLSSGPAEGLPDWRSR